MSGRAQLSDNWRLRDNTPSQEAQTTGSNNRGVQHLDRTHRNTEDQGPRVSEVLRGDDDPQTIQAIDEGRRLYVGNLPYMAKTNDVEQLFFDSGYHV